MPFESIFPFTAIVGQDRMKRALLLNAIDPMIGGVLIRGERGTAKSTAVRALARLLPDYDAVDGCPYRCDPAEPPRFCDECRRRSASAPLPVTRLPMRIVDLPINASEARLREQLILARRRLGQVSLPVPIRTLIARLCLDGYVAGHRADLVVAHTARALSALRGAIAVELDDVLAALDLALSHRRRDEPGDRQAQFQEVAVRAAEQLAQIQAEASLPQAQAADGDSPISQAGVGGDSSQGWTAAEPQLTKPSDLSEPEPDTVIRLATFPVKKPDLPRERLIRRAAGKRTSTKSQKKRGRYVRSAQVGTVTDVAFDATVRAAAPHQPGRRQALPLAANRLQLEPRDLRQKVRERKTGNLIVFVVDASASMDAEQRMIATKGAILSLLRHAYVRRDKVALVAFSGRNARVVLRPTSSVDLAERRLERLSIGGTTPLTHGLLTSLKLIKTERLRDPQVYPLLVLISDGRGNISLFGEEPLLEAQRMAGQIKQEGVRAMVIDSTRDFGSQPGYPRNRVTSLYGAYAFNVCGDLAERLGGRYYGLFDLSQSSIVDSVQREMLRTGSA